MGVFVLTCIGPFRYDAPKRDQVIAAKKSRGEKEMSRQAKILAFIALCICILGIRNGLDATQPFWSMEPSTQYIERADSLTGFDITKYVIELAVNDQTHFISGAVTANVTAEENLSGIDYRLTGGSLSVDQVLVNGTPVTGFTHLDGIVHIPLLMSAGTQFTTKVLYSGVPGNSPAPYNIGLRFTTNGMYTLSNPDAGRYWWPSYDHPWDKALVDWHITVRSDWLAAANGIRTGITDNGNGTRTHHWVCSSPVATYVIGFAAGPYVELNQSAGDLPIQNFVLAGQVANANIDFANVPEMIAYFSATFGPYPFEKYGHMVVNMATYAAMEHQTMTTYGAQYLTGNQSYESIVAHELAHQWYGNYITPLTMREVWLKESFATYSEALWTHHKLGWQSACDYIRASIQQYYINWENSNGPHVIFNPEYNLMFAPPTYEKSASVLHMLRLKMGNAAFFQFIRALLTTYSNGNLITSEFIALAQQISGLDLTQFFQQWIFSAGIPNAELTAFTNGSAQAKVWARSISPTATLFDLDIPISIPGSALADSVVVRATPEGFSSYFGIGAQDDLSTLLADPHNWVLARQITVLRPILQSCLPYNGAVALNWNAFVPGMPILGYNVYRKALHDMQYQLLTPQPVLGLGYTDFSVSNGTTYQYIIRAVDSEGFVSIASNALPATPIAFPFDMGFLVVDETRDGNGSAISPNDAMADAFYDSALEGFDYTQWDYTAQGAPSLDVLSHYPLVLWHADDFSEMNILNCLDLIGSYVLSGGKMLISGWKYPSVFSDGFKAQFLPGVSLDYHNSPVLISAQSDIYPDLHPDPLKLATVWNGMIPMSYTFTGSVDPLYSAEILDGGPGNGDAAAIRVQQNGTLVLLGFPLYFMLETQARAFLSHILPQLYPPLPVDDPSVPGVSLALNAYPNPFSSFSELRLELIGARPVGLEVYNIRGQKVFATGDPKVETTENGYELHPESPSLRQLPSGCYILKVRSNSGNITRKVLLIR